MSKIRIYELAKQIEKQSKDIVNYLKEKGIEKSHSSSLTEDEIDLVKKFFNKKITETKDKIEKEAEKIKIQTQEIIEKSKNMEDTVQNQNNTKQDTMDKANVQKNPITSGQNQNQPSQVQKRNTNAQNSNNGTHPYRNTQGNAQNRNNAGNTQNRNNTGTQSYNNGNTQNRSNTTNAQNRNNTSTQSYNNGNTQNRSNTGNAQNRNNTSTQSYNNGNPQNRSNTGNTQNRNNTSTQSYNNGNPQNRSNTGNTQNRNNTSTQSYNNGNTQNRSNTGSTQNRNNTSTQSYNNGNPQNRSNTGSTQNRNNAGGQNNNNNRNTQNNYNRKGNNNRGNFNNNNRFNRNKNNNQNSNPNANKDPNRKGAFIMPKPQQVQVEEDGIKTIILPEKLTIKELADKMKLQPSAIVKKLFLEGKMVSINQEISFEEAEEIAIEYDFIAELEEKIDIVAELLKEEDEDPSVLVKRPSVVCVMGHVDHGKTSLLDAIRETNVTSREAGGITQHIGAYVVDVNGEKITFLDTPGHEAFTAMRMRGAKSTDIAILVVAADDGVMPQTIEAINHAKAAGIEIIVAINKIDKPSANIERVKQELVEYQLIAEDWGGETIFVPVSAHTKEGIDQLLEMILLTSEMLELKANPDRNARGIVIEAQLDKGRGPVATILVQKGILHVGDSVAIGSAFGKVRAMMDDKGRRVKEAGPSMPVEILGLNDVPGAGEIVMATDNEKEARTISEAFIKQNREKLLEDTKAKLSLDGLFSQIQAGNIKELNLIVKADVQGSVEAVKQSLLKLSNEEVAIRIIHGGVGAINESDVILASASNAIIIGFNVRPDATAKDTAEREKVDVRLYRVIYNAIEDIEAAMKGMLDPVFEEKVIGHAEVRQVFKASGIGTIAGSYILDGKIIRGCKTRIIREGIVVFDGDLASLKRFKDDVKEVAAGYECGLVFDKFNDVKETDQVESYIMEEVPR